MNKPDDIEREGIEVKLIDPITDSALYQLKVKITPRLVDSRRLKLIAAKLNEMAHYMRVQNETKTTGRT